MEKFESSEETLKNSYSILLKIFSSFLFDKVFDYYYI